MRINARLDDSFAEKLDFLQQTMHLTVSDIVRESVERYYESVRAEQRRKRASLDRLVGAFDGGPEDGSSRYKDYIAEYLDEKYPRSDDVTKQS